MLKEKGHIVDTATNGLEALALHEQKRYDTILMDIQMPHMDGIGATQRIREREGLSSHTPIIALTAHTLLGDRERFLSMGMDEYLSKPINMNGLFQLIDHVMSKDSTNNEVWISDTGKVVLENRENSSIRLKNKSIIIQVIAQDIYRLAEAVKNTNMLEVENLALTIKSNCDEIEADELKTRVFKIQLAARRGNINEVISNAERIKSEFITYKKSESTDTDILPTTG